MTRWENVVTLALATYRATSAVFGDGFVMDAGCLLSDYLGGTDGETKY